MKILKMNIFVITFSLILLSVSTRAENPLFTVTPKKITPSVTFKIQLPNPHPDLFAVERPDKTWVYIILDEPKYVSPKFESFAKSTQITISTNEFKGIVFDDGKSQNTAVFTISGKYRFYVASNLQTEPENTDSIETYVEYTSSTK